MSAIDKNQAVIDFLLECPQIASNPLYFNFVNAKNDDKQFVTLSNEVSLHQPYIDGSVLKRFTFTIIDYKSVAYRAIPKYSGLTDENINDMLDVQAIIDWITDQADAKNYPNFGDDCLIDNMETVTDNPNLNGVDTNITPALAKYSITIRIDYLDKSKVIWN